MVLREEKITASMRVRRACKKSCLGDSLATMTGYARHIGVTRRTLMLWCERYPEFKEAYEWAEELNADQIARASFMGSTPSRGCRFAAGQLPWLDLSSSGQDAE